MKAHRKKLIYAITSLAKKDDHQQSFMEHNVISNNAFSTAFPRQPIFKNMRLDNVVQMPQLLTILFPPCNWQGE